MGRLFNPSPYASLNAWDPTDVRWAPGYRHPTVHGTNGANAAILTPGLYFRDSTTTMATSFWTNSSTAATEPSGFTAAQLTLPSTAAASLGTLGGVAGIAFGSPVTDPVFDGTSGTSRQMADLHGNRTLPNVPVFAPAAGLRAGRWEFSGTFWVDSAVNTGSGLTYGWNLVVAPFPSSVPATYIGFNGTNAANVTVSGPGGSIAESGTASTTVAPGTAYRFTISKTAYNAAATSATYRAQFGGVIDYSWTSNTQYYTDHLSLFFTCGSNNNRPFRILDARYRHLL
jgi:hypothetical protein